MSTTRLVISDGQLAFGFHLFITHPGFESFYKTYPFIKTEQQPKKKKKKKLNTIHIILINAMICRLQFYQLFITICQTIKTHQINKITVTNNRSEVYECNAL